MTRPDVSWIPAFWRQIQPWVFLREADQVLILPPNQVYKTNPTAYKLLRWLEAGGRLKDLPGWNDERARDTQAFFVNLKTAVEGGQAASVPIPYSFDFTRLPVLGELAVTYRCNHRCLFCYAGCGGPCGLPPGWENKAELRTADLKRLIDLFRDEAQIPFVSFTGGEPLIRPDLEEVMAHAVARGLRINLISNGTLATPARARSLYAAGLRTAQISLEAPTSDLHDQLCGASTAFERTWAGIAALQAAGIAVQTNTTLNALNAGQAEAMVDLLAERGITRFSMNLFIPTKASPRSAELFLRYSDVGPLVDRVRARAAVRGLTFYWYSPTPLGLFDPISRGLGNKACAACDGLIHADPEGNLLPCSSWPEPVGNLLSEGFAPLWFGPRAQALKHKEAAPLGCERCAKFKACQGACPLYWDYAGLDELALCRAQEVSHGR